MAHRKSTSFLNTIAQVSKTNRRSVSTLDLDNSEAANEVYDAILKDPIKRKLVLQLLSQEKEAIDEYLRKEKSNTPLKKLKNNGVGFSSPSALQRQRLLKKRQNNDADDSSSSSSIEAPRALLPFDKLLEGVIAYVEVNTRDGDRSTATKAVVRAMGATIRDEFTRDVTHIIFKDGSYTTYQRAKLLKKHLVSLLWIEAVKTNRYRVPEKNFPALGVEGYNGDMSLLCQQFQEEYEDAVREEYGRLKTSPKKSISRRKTALPSELVSSVKACTNLPPIDDFIPSSQDSEIVAILDKSSTQKPATPRVDSRQLPNSSPELTSDGSSCGVIDGEVSRNINAELELMDWQSSPANVLQVTESENVDSSAAKVDVLKSIENITANNISEPQNSTKTSNTSNGTTSILNHNYVSKVYKNTKEKSSILAEKSRNVSDTSDMELTNNLSSLQIKFNLENISDSNVKTPDSTGSVDMPSLRISATGSECSSNKNEINSSENNPVAVDKKQKRKNSLEIYASPKQIRIQLKTLKPKENKVKIGKRKLYDPNQSIDKSLIPSFMQDDDKRDTNKTTFKKDTIVLTPVLVTARAKKLLDNKSKNTPTKKTVKQKSPDVKKQVIDNKSKIKDTPAKKTDKEKSPVVKKQVNATLTTPNRFKTPAPVTERRKSLRISQIFARKEEEASTSSQSFLSLDKSLPITPIKRRSTMDFVNNSSAMKKKSEKKEEVLRSIVCTRLHKPDVEVFTQIVRKMGGFIVEDEVSARTTHLVAGEPLRTINLLRAISRGCWIVRHEWLFKSLEAGKWLPEEPFELAEFSKSVRKCRIERQAFGKNYTIDIFKNCGYIYVARSTQPRCSDLQELIRLGKGKITTVQSRAKIVIGEYVEDETVICVKETWVLDCITFNKVKPFDDYLINN